MKKGEVREIREIPNRLTVLAVVISEEILIKKENRRGRVFIISGLAGTGKSTILSNYYERIKQEYPDTRKEPRKLL